MPIGSPPTRIIPLADVHAKVGQSIVVEVRDTDDALEIYSNQALVATYELTKNPNGATDLEPSLNEGVNLIWFDSTDYGPQGQNWWTVNAGVFVNGSPNPSTQANYHNQRLGQHDVHETWRYQFNIILTK